MGLFTGIRIITLLELAFWIVRFLCRHCFPSFDTGHQEEKKETIDSLAKRFAILEKRFSHGTKERGKVSKPRRWPSFKAH